MSAAERLDAIEARANAAPEWPSEPVVNSAGNLSINISGYTTPEWNARNADVVRFIAAARQDVPRMVAALRAVLDLADEVIVSPRRTNRWVHADRIVAAVESALDPS